MSLMYYGKKDKNIATSGLSFITLKHTGLVNLKLSQTFSRLTSFTDESKDHHQNVWLIYPTRVKGYFPYTKAYVNMWSWNPYWRERICAVDLLILPSLDQLLLMLETCLFLTF